MPPHSGKKRAQLCTCLIFSTYTANEAFQEQNAWKNKPCLLTQPGATTWKKSRKAFKAVTDLVLALQWPNQSKPWTPSNQERRPPSNTAYKLAHLPPPQLLLLRKNCTRDRPSPSYACHMAVQTGCLLRNKQSTFPVQPLLTAEGKETPVPFHNLLQLSAITSHHYLLWGTQFSLRRLKKKKHTTEKNNNEQ